MKHRDYISELINHPLSQINEDEISYMESIGKDFASMAQIQKMGYSPKMSQAKIKESFDKFLDLPTYLIETYGDKAPDPQWPEFTWAEDIWNLYFCSDITN